MMLLAWVLVLLLSLSHDVQAAETGFYLMENGVDFYLMENGVDFYVLEGGEGGGPPTVSGRGLLMGVGK